MYIHVIIRAWVCMVAVGTLDIHKELEQMVAKFVGKPAALVFGMGFATNSTNIPALVGKVCCNHSSSLPNSSTVMFIPISIRFTQ